MDRGAMFAESHDLLLRKLPDTTGKPLAHWVGLLNKAGYQRKGFLAGLHYLRDEKNVPHNEAAAILYTYMNPYLAPDDLRSGQGRSKNEDLEDTLKVTRTANARLRAKAASKARTAAPKAKPAPRAKAKAKPASKAKAAPKAKPAPKPKANPAPRVKTKSKPPARSQAKAKRPAKKRARR